MTNIFSKTALETLDDHSEAEEMPRVASPKLILVLGAMLAMLAVAIYWCAFGTINYKVTAQGVIFPFETTIEDEAGVQTLPDNGRELLVYASFNDLRKLKTGQQVQVTPADLERESCGYAYGKITAIAHYHTTRQAVAKRLKQPIEKFPMNIEKTGNTSSASIPILFDEMKKQGLIGQGKKKIVMSSFGAGLLWGAVQTEI